MKIKDDLNEEEFEDDFDIEEEHDAPVIEEELKDNLALTSITDFLDSKIVGLLAELGLEDAPKDEKDKKK